MTIPIWNASLPRIVFPIKSGQESSKRYFGKKAITRGATAIMEIAGVTNSTATALYDFWKNDCNYGLDPFLIPLPFFGQEIDTEKPNLLVQFVGTLEINGEIIWTSSINLTVLGTIQYVVDDETKDFIINDETSDFVIVDDNLIATPRNINYKGVLYGS
ncbi:MAG: hypothetical protein PHI79_08110 [Sulfurovaceae bacterium]|nr:hypothetical protein [Sulfurovaceae bacterium]MDD5549539.1 hypothetical protein [Sulfurovaceae bacterium]